MTGNCGSQLTEIRVFGYHIETINGTLVTKLGMQHLLRNTLTNPSGELISDRHARAIVSSLQAKGWSAAAPNSGLRLHDAFMHVDSAYHYVTVAHDDQCHQARVENGRKRWLGSRARSI